MGRVLASLAPDVVLLQEVDFGASRSHGIDQAEHLARAAGLPYVAKAVSWEANYIPFPYWPPESHFGAMRSGGAILSRFPLSDHRVETVAKPEENPFWYNLFYLFRYHQEVTVEAPFGEVKVFNAHLEAFEQESRVRHARLLAERVSGEMTPFTVVGGDFNTVLPEASLRRDYPDEPQTSHVDDPTLELLRGVDGLVDTVAGETYLSSEDAWLTFPAHDPNRKLDYILVGAGFEVVGRKVPRGVAGDLSDHLPVWVRLKPL
jgi:endonuclease/exonuclease/phosphatase family metal-dependent hydrolase